MRLPHFLPVVLFALAPAAQATADPAPFARVLDYIRDNVHPNSAGNEQVLLVRNPDGQSADLILLPNVHLETTGEILARYASVASVTTHPDQRAALVWRDAAAPGQTSQLQIEYLDAREAAPMQWRRTIVLDWTTSEPSVISIDLSATSETNGADFECIVNFATGEWLWGVYTDDDELTGEGTEGLPGPIPLSTWRWDHPNPEICRPHLPVWPPQ